MIQASDILTAFKARWDANQSVLTQNLGTLVPGGLNEGLVPREASTPYASIKVEEGDPQWLAGTSNYLVTMTVTITIWSTGGPVDAGQIRTAIAGTYPQSATLTVPSGSRQLHLLPKKGTLEEDPATAQAKDVKLASMAWEVLLSSAGV